MSIDLVQVDPRGGDALDNQPIVDPMGAGERMSEAIRRLEQKRQELALLREEEVPKKKRKESTKKAKENYQKSLYKFSENFFGEEHKVYGEEAEALAELFYARAKKYVLASSFLLLGSFAGIICLMNIFSYQWGWALIPWIISIFPTFFSWYSLEPVEPDFDYHFKFLYARRKLKKLGAKGYK